MNPLADIGNGLAEEIAAKDQTPGPATPARNVIGNIAGVPHACRTGDGGAEGAGDRNEAGKYDGFAAVVFVEVVRLSEVTPLKKQRILAAIKRLSGLSSDPVAELVAHNCAGDH